LKQVKPALEPELFPTDRLVAYSGAFFAFAAILVALWNVWASIAGYIGLILLYILPATWAARPKGGAGKR
jgi:hypothetical protein